MAGKYMILPVDLKQEFVTQSIGPTARSIDRLHGLNRYIQSIDTIGTICRCKDDCAQICIYPAFILGSPILCIMHHPRFLPKISSCIDHQRACSGLMAALNSQLELAKHVSFCLIHHSYCTIYKLYIYIDSLHFYRNRHLHLVGKSK